MRQTDPFEPPPSLSLETPVSFDQLVERSDFLVIQAPLTLTTYHLFDEAHLKGMKRAPS